MNKVNLPPEQYYKQTNNELLPYEACMPTARAMFYVGNDMRYDNNSDYGNDDYIMSLLHTEEASEALAKVAPWAIGYYPAHQVHAMYPFYLDGVLFGRPMSNFVDNYTFEMVYDDMLDGRVLMTSGNFSKEIPGHAICFIGCGEDASGEYLLIADPFGDYHNDYKSGSGYGVKMYQRDYYDIIKPIDCHKKWMHVPYN